MLLEQHRREQFSNNFISFLPFRCRFLSLICVFYVMLLCARALPRQDLISPRSVFALVIRMNI